MSTITPSEAVFAFAGWLTSRREVTIMSDTHDAAPIADLVSAFCESQGLEPPRDGWHKLLQPYPADEPPVWP
jgi:hypothetical protein